MSAFICSDDHINTIVSRYKTNSHKESQEMATILLNENVRSINYRYEENNKDTIVYECVGIEIPVVGVLKLCQSYAYQCCETKDWETTRAYNLLQEIIDQLLVSLPGYDESEWSI